MTSRLRRPLPLEPRPAGAYLRRMANNSSGWMRVKMILLVGLAVVRATLTGTLCPNNTETATSGKR